jgi:integrase/recombinase XerD
MSKNVKILEAYHNELLRCEYSENTIKVYDNFFKRYCEYFENDDIRYVSDESIKRFLLHLVDEIGISYSYQNQMINSIKFYYEKVLNLPRKTYYINRPRKEHHLPTVLSVLEVKKLLSTIKNLKHYTMISLLYGSGLRISELKNLQITDIDGQRMVINVRQAKGKKDRQTILSVSQLEILRKYYREYKPNTYLFNGQNSLKYSSRSIQEIVKKAAFYAGIKKHVHPHTLRHCFATHLFESGTDLRVIQELLGHSNIKTTQIYTHVTTSHISKIESPFDKLKNAA